MTELSYEICLKLKPVVDQTLNRFDLYYYSLDDKTHIYVWDNNFSHKPDSDIYLIKIPSLEDLLGCLTVDEFEKFMKYLNDKEWNPKAHDSFIKDNFKSILAEWIIRKKKL